MIPKNLPTGYLGPLIQGITAMLAKLVNSKVYECFLCLDFFLAFNVKVVFESYTG